MKKILYSLGLLGLALAGCTSEEKVDFVPKNNVINFENVVNKGSRAAVSGDLNTDNLDKFYVFGYYTKAGLEGHPVQIFNSDEVYKTDGKWSYTGERYWVPGATYYFYAYSCADIKLNNDKGTTVMNLNETSTSPESRALTITDYECDKDHQHDLIYAANEGLVGKDTQGENAQPNSIVTFKFKHLLTRINATFTSEFPAGYDIIVKNVKMRNIRNYGDYVHTVGQHTGAWQNIRRGKDPITEEPNAIVDLVFPTKDAEGNDIVTNVTSAATDDKEAVKAETFQAFVIPCSYSNSDVFIEFDIDVVQGNDIFLSRHMSGTFAPEWLSGYQYTYNIKLSGSIANLEAIVFNDNVEIEGWQTGTIKDFNISAN